MKEMKKTAIALIMIIAAALCLSSCDGDGTHLIGVSLNTGKSISDADYFEVKVDAGSEGQILYRTPNSVFPSLLQISVPDSSTSVTVSSYRIEEGSSKLVGTGNAAITTSNSDDIEVVMTSVI
jgi:biotin synthase-related radical SAM superfamily protein